MHSTESASSDAWSVVEVLMESEAEKKEGGIFLGIDGRRTDTFFLPKELEPRRKERRARGK